MELPNNDRLLLSFVVIFGAFFLCLLITLYILNLSGNISIVAYAASCLFVFSIILIIYTHFYGKKFIDDTLTQMTDLFASGVSHIESVGMLTATPLITPYGRIALADPWQAQPLSLRNTGVGAALNVSTILTDGKRCLISRGTSVVIAGEKEKIALVTAKVTSHFPDQVDGLPLLSREHGEPRLIVFYQDTLGMPYAAVYAARGQTWTFLGTARKTTLTFEELVVAA